MSTYTKTLDDIYFLNDKNLVSSIDGDSAVNAVPTMDLMRTSYSKLSGMSDSISAYIDNLDSSTTLTGHHENNVSIITNINQTNGKLELTATRLLSSNVYGLSNYVDEKINNLTKDKQESPNKFVRSITENAGIITAEFEQVLSSDIAGSLQQSQVENLPNALANIETSANALNSKIDDSVKDLSDTVNANYVHLTGDTINGNVVVNGQLTAAQDAVILSGIYVGTNLDKKNYGNVVVLGDNTEPAGRDSFVWNGDNGHKYDVSEHGEHGTFNINPEGDLNGFYIGQRTLSGILSEYLLSANERTDLSQFTDNGHKYALSIDVPTKVSQLENDSAYLISSDFNATYNDITKKIEFKAGEKTWTIDATAFIKDGMLSSAELVRYKEDEPEAGYWLKLIFNTDAGKAPIYIDVKQLADIYTADTDGISVVNYKIGLDYSVVARKENVDANATNINVLSNTTIPTITSNVETISTHVDVLQAYDNKLSGTGGRYGDETYGIIPTIQDDILSIRNTVLNATTFAGVLTLNHTQRYSEEGNSLSNIFKYFNLAENNQLKNGNFYQVIFTDISADVDAKANAYIMTEDGAKSIKLADKDFIIVHSRDGNVVTLETLIDNIELIPAVRWFEHYELSATVRDNYLWLSGGNRLTAQWGGSDNKKYTNHAISGNNDIGGNNHFLDGNNTFDGRNFFPEEQTDFNEISVRTNARIDNNLSVGNEISVKNTLVVATTLTANQFGLSTTNDISVKNKLTVDNNIINTNVLSTDVGTQTLSAVNVSVDILSADWSKVVDTATNPGFSLHDLSDAVSSKIFISSCIESDQMHDTSDLSIIKISKEEYDERVATNDENPTLCANTLYIVDSDYIDAYGQTIKNLSTDGEEVVADAANVNYVDNHIVSAINALDVDNKFETYDANKSISIITNLRETDGKIDYSVAKLLSSNVDGLKNYVDTCDRQVKTDLCAAIHNNSLAINNDSNLSDIISAVVAIWSAFGGKIKA